MRRLQFAMIALVATSFGATLITTSAEAKPPVKKSSSKKKSTRSRDRKGCPPVRRTRRTRPSGTRTITRVVPGTNTKTIVEREVIKKVTIDQATIDKLKEEILSGIKFPDVPAAKVDLSSLEARLTALEASITSIQDQMKKDRTFDLRKTAHFEEQLCDILTIVKKQQECLDELCKKNVGTRSMPSMNTMAPVAGAGAAIHNAKVSISRDIDGNIFNGSNFRVQTGLDIGKVPVIGGILGGDSALQVYADHFEVPSSLGAISGAGLAGRFYNGNSGKVRLYAGAGAGVYTTNFAKSAPHQTESGGKLFVGLETNRRTFLEFNVTSVQNYGPASRTAKVYFGQRF